MSSDRFVRVWALVLALAGAGVVAAVARGPESAPKAGNAGPAVRYGRDIRPILSDRCFQCHGPDAGKREAGLRLDLREEATAVRSDGPAAIVPGSPGRSEMWRRVMHPDSDEVMPPPSSHKRALTDSEKDLLRRWIEQGAVYENHWSFVPPARPGAPAAVPGLEGWAKNPIDGYIAAGLAAQGWKPAAEAPREVLLRRLFLDLTGLPPTPEELDAFLSDERPDAYERWVDRLLTEEPYLTRYAERMATPWMDQARYADTCGIHMDAGRQMWLWRDWVIDAYRSHMPFDRFVTEQLAGDLLPNASEAQRIASGFNRNHVTTDEGGAISEEYLVEYAVDRTVTTSSVLLGLTVGCARCHDHKYDPVSMEDFYRLYAFFNSIEEPGLYSQTPDASRAYEPFIVVPTGEQKQRIDEISAELAQVQAKIDVRSPEEESQRREFLTQLLPRAGVTWARAAVTSAASKNGATLKIVPDGSVVAAGANPAQDEHELMLHTDQRGLRVLLLEALPEPSAFEGRLGRAPNGNAVVTDVEVEAISTVDSRQRHPVAFHWAWADWSQQNGDFDVTNVLNSADTLGWALDGHRRPGGRVAVLVSPEPFGYEGGTELRVRLGYRSEYPEHTLARVRVDVGSIGDAGLAMLPTASSRSYVAGPFPGDQQNRVFEPTYGPEEGDVIDLSRKFGNQAWRFDESLVDGKVVALAEGRNVSYVGRVMYSTVAREVPVSLGSDDGFRLYVNGVEAAKNDTNRGVMPDQDQAKIKLRPGRNAVVLKIVNTGGLGGYYWKTADAAELGGDLVAALLPERAVSTELAARLERAWRVAFLPSYKAAEQRMAELRKENDSINAAVPRTMVMKELEKARDTFVLSRGRYDSPDKDKRVERGVPRALGTLPQDAPPNRLGLAQWMVSAENPLTARVTVNRLWELAFGAGIVRTSEDFGLQGEWPSHPELLDWLAVELRESGWDTAAIMRLIVTSATYRQDSTVRMECQEADPDNRLLAYYPRRRLSAEQIRDQALYVSGLLVERAGGPSVKPYQPEGLWQEVAMPQSNTREYKQGEGDELWRRSLYTYWKRACPPPSLLIFDAPTREFCTISRASTSTPLQALVLWNDEQFVEAARALAERLIKDESTDQARLRQLFRRCTGGAPDAREAEVLSELLSYFRARYRSAEPDAAALVGVGMAPRRQDVATTELAAWTMTASTVMNLYRATTQE